MISVNTLPGTKVVGLPDEDVPSDHELVRPAYRYLLDSYVPSRVDMAGKEYTVTAIVLELMATSGFSVRLLETGSSRWPLEAFVEVVTSRPVGKKLGVLEPA